MVRVAVTLIYRDTPQLLAPWLAHHARLFGPANLFVIGASPALRDLPRQGVNLIAPGPDPLLTQRDLIAALKANAGHDLVIPLQANSFLAAIDTTGLTVAPAAIHEALAEAAAAPRPLRLDHTAESRPGRLDLFRLHPSRDPIIPLAAIPHGIPLDETIPLDHAPATDRLILLRLCATEWPEPHRGALLAWSGFARSLAETLPDPSFATTWCADPGPEPSAYEAIPLDTGFDAAAYLAANPDLVQSKANPLLHFCWAGYHEGRRRSPGPDGCHEALARMAGFRAAHPDLPAGYRGLFFTYHMINQLDAADRILTEGHARFPQDAAIANHWVLTALYSKNPTEAARRAEILRGIAPADPAGYSLGVSALRDAGDHDAAVALAEQGVARFPTERNMLQFLAETAYARGDFTASDTLWRRLIAGHPDDVGLREVAARHLHASHAMRAEDADAPELDELEAPVVVAMSEAETKSALAALGLPDEAAMRSFFMRFESFGESCEFGLMQRRFGAEPMGLLRWSSMHFGNLVKGLQERFSAFEDPANIYLRTGPNEYALCDHRYRTIMHTFIHPEQMREEEALRRMHRRVVFLRKKLLEDLEEGEKIFVYVDSQRASQMDLLHLHAAIRAYGPGSLLYVTADPTRAGTVETLAPGLFHARLPRRGNDGPQWNIDFENWIKICLAARDHVAQSESNSRSG